MAAGDIQPDPALRVGLDLRDDLLSVPPRPSGREEHPRTGRGSTIGVHHRPDDRRAGLLRGASGDRAGADPDPHERRGGPHRVASPEVFRGPIQEFFR